MSEDADTRVRRLAKGSGVLMLGFVVELGLAFLAKLAMARVLGKVDYGSVAIGIVLAANLSTIVLLGMHHGVARYLPRYDDRARRRGVLVSAYQIAVPLAIVVGVGLAVFADPISRIVLRDPDVAPVLVVFGLATPFAAVMKLGVGSIRGTQRSTPKVVVRNLLMPIVRFGLVVAALLAGLRTLGVSYAYFGTYVIAAVAALYYVYRHTPLFERSAWEPMHRTLLRYSSPLAVMALAQLVVAGIAIDTVMIAYFAETADVGDYNVIVPTAKLLIVVVSAVAFLFMPIVSELHADGATDEMARLFRVATKWIVLGTLPLFAVFTLFPGEFLALTFGAEYRTAAVSLVVLSIGYFVNAAMGPNRRVLNAVGETPIVMIDTLIAGTVNVVGNLLLVPQYSLFGAAVATTGAYVTVNALYAFHVYRRVGFHPMSDSLVRPGIAGVVVLGGVAMLARETLTVTPLVLVGLVLAVAPVYVATVLYFGAVDREEVMLVLSAEEKYGVDLGAFKRVAKLFVD